MLDFYKTVGGRKFCDHTIPELIRKLDKVAELDFDGLTKAMNRLAKAQEDANRLAKEASRFQAKEQLPDFGPMEAGEANAFVEQLMLNLNLAGKDGIVLRGNNARQIMYCTSMLDNLPVAFSPEGDWVRVWKVGISDNQAEREVEQILKVMMESDRDSMPCHDEIAKMIRDNPRVSGRLTGKGVKIDDAFGIMSLTKPVALGEAK